MPTLPTSLLAVIVPVALAAQTSEPRTLERDLLEQLVEINTSDSARLIRPRRR
jgi:hypothetical protein